MTLLRSIAVTALALTFGTAAPAQPAAQTILVYSFGFSPRPIHLAAGRPVTLTFVNRSGSGHDFSAKSFFAGSTIVRGSAPGGEIDLGPRETRSITLIPRAGSYNAKCTHFLHKQMGMSDQIVVN
jgi:plastocyanin